MGMQAHTWLNKFLSGRIQVKNDLTGFKQVFQTHRKFDELYHHFDSYYLCYLS